MKKKYQIPESVSEKGYLRTSLLAGSVTNPTPGEGENISGNPSQPNPDDQDEGEARRRRGTNLMDF